MDTVKCGSCSGNVVPRLWHYGGGIASYMKTQHMCPLCGVVMYETGGGIRTWPKLIFFLFVMAYAKYHIDNSTSGLTKDILGVLWALFWIYIILARPIYSFVKGFINGMK